MLAHALKSNEAFSIEGIHGELLDMSTHQVAETFFDAFYFFCYHHKDAAKTLKVCCSSEKISQVYLKTFEYKINFLPPKVPKRKSKFVDNYRKELNRAYNQVVDRDQDIYESIKNAEMYFGSANTPTRVELINKFLMATKDVTEVELENTLSQREKDCSEYIKERFSQFKHNVNDFLTDIFNTTLQFSYETLVKTLYEFQKDNSSYLTQVKLDLFLASVTKAGSAFNSNLVSPNAKALKKSASKAKIKRRLSVSGEKKDRKSVV